MTWRGPPGGRSGTVRPSRRTATTGPAAAPQDRAPRRAAAVPAPPARTGSGPGRRRTGEAASGRPPERGRESDGTVPDAAVARSPAHPRRGSREPVHKPRARHPARIVTPPGPRPGRPAPGAPPDHSPGGPPAAPVVPPMPAAPTRARSARALPAPHALPHAPGSRRPAPRAHVPGLRPHTYTWSPSRSRSHSSRASLSLRLTHPAEPPPSYRLSCRPWIAWPRSKYWA